MNATDLNTLGGKPNAYHKLFEIGRGGMARVYLAESVAFGIRKLVVLKVLNPEFSADPEMRASFRREAELSAQINHPNVVQVLAVVENSGGPVIVMEYLEGTPLSILLQDAGEHLPLRLRMQILSQVLAGLHCFHELKDIHGMPLNAVHRDVSPQNVMILYDGPVKVLDFGIAKINAPNDQVTRTGTIKGKLRYMAPEQLLGGAGIDRRADVFSVGVMLWEALAKRRMWEGTSEVQLLRGLATGSLPSLREAAPAVPSVLHDIVERATALDPTHRFASAREMRDAMDCALTHEGWLVQPRELGDFMLQHFGERRRVQELRLKSALRILRSSTAATNPASESRLVTNPPSESRLATNSASGSRLATNSTSGSRLATNCSEPRDTRRPANRTSDLAVARTLRKGRRSRRLDAILIVSACVMFAGGAAIWRWMQSLDQAPAQVSPKTVAFEVEVRPSGAEIFLNGRSLGRERYVGEQPLTGESVVLEARAPGYVSKRMELTLHKDIVMGITLDPNPALALPPASASSAPSASPPLDASSVPVPVPSRKPARATRKAANLSARNPSRKCNPPYAFDADGVKMYKPECF